jgi:hypothetical protein
MRSGFKSRWALWPPAVWTLMAIAGPGTAAAGNNATVAEQNSTVPTVAGPAAVVAVRVQVVNTGDTTWRAGSAHRLGAGPSNQVSWSSFPCGGYMNNLVDGRVFLCREVAPGQAYDFQFNVQLPSSGSGVLSVRMVQDGVEWFGETQTWSITVSGGPACATSPLPTPADQWRLEIFNNKALSGKAVDERAQRDVAAEAAWIAQQIGKPVRLQWMRDEGIAWDPKGPPHVTTMSAGIDANGKVIAWDYAAWLLNGTQRAAGALIAGDTLIGQAMGYEPLNTIEHGTPADNYTFANKRRVSNVVSSKWAYQTGLRTAHLRDPNGPQTTFASEQFVDEVAASLKLDPIDFRLSHFDPMTAARDINVIEQVKKASGWVSRPSPAPSRRARG